LLRVKDANGREDYIRDDQGHVVKSHLNEKLLQQIAGATDGGFYLPLRGAKAIDVLYERGLAPLPKTEGQEKLVKRYYERYHWPLAAAILLLLVEMLLPERKRLTESKVQSPKSKVQVSAATAILALFLLPTAGNASPSSALKEFNAGKFTNALTEYEHLLAAQAKLQKPEDPRLHFNAGAAAYRATNYSGAIRHFSAVLSAQDIQLQAKAYYNLGNVHFRLGQQAEDLDKLEESWKEAIKQYEHAVTLDKADPDAAFNLAFVKHAVEQVKLMREAALRARATADQEVRRRNYHRALEIMEQLLQQNIAAKPFEEFTKKLKNIDGIANPTPAPAQP
jgi:Ca-activated chloride channel family protein